MASKVQNTRSPTYPKMDAIRKDVEGDKILSKLVGRQQNDAQSRHIRNAGTQNSARIQTVSQQTADNVHDNDNIMQLLPDTEIAAQVLISCILSPKDMINVELGYNVSGQQLESALSAPMLEVMRSYFNETYNIKSLLPTILRESLFEVGCYPVLIIPESSVDNLINNDARVAMESFKSGTLDQSIGILGPSDAGGRSVRPALESFDIGSSRLRPDECKVGYGNSGLDKIFNNNVEVTDNIGLLLRPTATRNARVEQVARAYGGRTPSMEAKSLVKGTGKQLVKIGKKDKKKQRISDAEFTRGLYPHRAFMQRPTMSLKTTAELENPTKGHPLTIKLPAESIIPVHVPSNPEDHVGYFVLLDQFGNPLKNTSKTDYYNRLSNDLNSNNELGRQLLNATQQGVQGNRSRERMVSTGEAVQMYASIVEKDLVSRLKNGAYGDGVVISRPMDVYRVMMSRALANMGTQVLYVPAELVTYFAFDYNENGVGKSLLEENKMLASMRAVLMFSNTMAAIKNSTTRTNLSIQLDPEDPDPQSTVEFLTAQYMQNNRQGFPIGTNDPVEIVDYLRHHGVSVEVTGNTAYPETKLETSESQPNRTMIDRDLDEDLKDRYFMKLGITPETIDATRNAEFATSIVSSNLLLAKRVTLYQGPLLAGIKDFQSKYAYNSSEIYDELMEAVKNNRSEIENKEITKLEDDQIVDLFLEVFEVTLPAPDSAKLDQQFQLLDTYRRGLEVAVSAYINEDMWGMEQLSDRAGDIRAVREAIISYYMRDYMQRNNILPELQKMVLRDEEDEPLISMDDVIGDHFEMFNKSLTKTIEEMKERREERDAKSSEGEGDPNASAYGGVGANSDNNTSEGFSGGGFGGDGSAGGSDSAAFGGNDFNF